MKRFYITFTSVLLAPLLVFDLIFDDKQELFMELNHRIIIGSIVIALVWMIGFYLINRKFRVVEQ